MFAHRYPALVDPATGFPRTWRQFITGLEAMSRESARESLRIAGAVTVPKMEKAAREKWYGEQTRAAGW